MAITYYPYKIIFSYFLLLQGLLGGLDRGAEQGEGEQLIGKVGGHHFLLVPIRGCGPQFEFVKWSETSFSIFLDVS